MHIGILNDENHIVNLYSNVSFKEAEIIVRQRGITLTKTLRTYWKEAKKTNMSELGKTRTKARAILFEEFS